MLINAFVGGMVGIERTVVPLIGTEEFGIASTTLVVSFIASFGVVKALNQPRLRRAGRPLGPQAGARAWLVVCSSVPFIIIWAPGWNWIVVAANALLGVSQGLAWSMTVFMKIDLVGPKGRGTAVGLNEFAGYLAVGVTAFLTGWLAAKIWASPGAHLDRGRLRHPRRLPVYPPGSRHARICSDGSRR